MPWTVNDPPPPAKNWPTSQKRRCVAAANSALRSGKSDEEAIRACIGAAKRKAKMTEPEVKKDYGEDAFVLSVVPMGATTFGEVEEYEKAEETAERVHELTRQFQTLSGNILYSETVPDKGSALKNLVDELDAKLGQALVKEKVTLRGIVKGVKSFLAGEPKVPETKPGLMIWKEGDAYRWLAIYSNKYRDDDRPREILASAAHKQFIKEVEAGQAPYPELWHWHVPGTRWGQSDWLAFDDDTGFSLASGWVDADHAKEAETLAGLDLDVRVSHGMPEASIERDEKDRTIITRYRSVEISDLPGFAAANPLTSFQVLKEGANMIPDEKLAYLKMVGLSEEKIDALKADLDGKAKEAQARGLEFKETAVTEPEPEPETVEEVEPAAEEETPPVVEPALTLEGIGKAMSDVLAPFVARLEANETSLKGLTKPIEEKVAEKAADTPAASLSALILKNLSVRGSEKAKVGEKAEGEGPAETKAAGKTGIQFIDSMLAAK